MIIDESVRGNARPTTTARAAKAEGRAFTPAVRLHVALAAMALTLAAPMTALADSYCTYRCMNNGEINGDCVRSCELEPGPAPGPAGGRGRTTYGAIYIDPNNAHHFGYSIDYPSRAAAAARADSECRARARRSCDEVLWFSNACGSLALAANGDWGAKWANGRRAAEQSATRACRSVRGQTCSVAASVCTP